jgi:hypothetical protein
MRRCNAEGAAFGVKLLVQILSIKLSEAMFDEVVGSPGKA